MAAKTAEQLLTVKQFADRIAVSVVTAYRRVYGGEVRWINVAPAGAKRASIRVPESALADYLRRRERGGAS